jgi:hypothetical protein
MHFDAPGSYIDRSGAGRSALSSLLHVGIYYTTFHGPAVCALAIMGDPEHSAGVPLRFVTNAALI